MYLPDGVAILICCSLNMNVLSRRGNNFELFWRNKEGVVRRGVKFVLLVNKTMHVFIFARGSGNFDLFWCI
jgi:hypothetical protein